MFWRGNVPGCSRSRETSVQHTNRAFNIGRFFTDIFIPVTKWSVTFVYKNTLLKKILLSTLSCLFIQSEDILVSWWHLLLIIATLRSCLLRKYTNITKPVCDHGRLFNPEDGSCCKTLNSCFLTSPSSALHIKRLYSVYNITIVTTAMIFLSPNEETECTNLNLTFSWNTDILFTLVLYNNSSILRIRKIKFQEWPAKIDSSCLTKRQAILQEDSN